MLHSVSDLLAARWIVARPLADPIPLPLIALAPIRLNLSKHVLSSEYCLLIIPRDSHWRIRQHIWDDIEADHRPANVDLV